MRQHFDQAFIEKVTAGIRQMQSRPHLQVLDSIPEINKPVVRNRYTATAQIASPINVVTFNIERGTRLDPLLIYLREHPVLAKADIILANELDWGMERSGNRNISEEIADALQMNYAYGIEFVTAKAGQDGNQGGLHGNTIFAKNPIEETTVFRLPIAYEWFDSHDSRLGTRIAILSTVNISGQKIGLVCAHLENRTTPEQRLMQFKALLDEVDRRFKDLPVIIGGDMNTNCIDGNDEAQIAFLAHNPDEQQKRILQVDAYEPLIKYAASRGYQFETCNVPGQPTRRKHMPDTDDILMNLDWFFCRKLMGDNPQVVKSIYNSNELPESGHNELFNNLEMSDHDAIAATFEFEG